MAGTLYQMTAFRQLQNADADDLKILCGNTYDWLWISNSKSAELFEHDKEGKIKIQYDEFNCNSRIIDPSSSTGASKLAFSGLLFIFLLL